MWRCMALAAHETLYLLHGLLKTATGQFAGQLSAWKREMTPIPIDLPGHGRCRIDAHPNYIATSIRYSLAVMDRVGAGHLIAASYLGGPVAVRCAEARPDLVRSLVLTGFVPDVPGDVFSVWIASFSQVAAENPELVKWYERQHGSRWSNTLAAYTADARERYSSGVGITGKAIGALSCPTLILNGSFKSNERRAALEAAHLGPRVRGQVIDEAGHIPSQDRPGQFLAIVREFWDNHGDGDDLPIA